MKKPQIKIILLVALVSSLAAAAVFYYGLHRSPRINRYLDQNLESQAMSIFHVVTVEKDGWIYPRDDIKGFYELGKSTLNIPEEPKAAGAYASLDYLDRAVNASGCLGPESMPDQESQREEIYDFKPTGWNQKSYEFIMDGNVLYNRCHLIGWFLGGENANWRNLITGTRYFNKEGMLPVEIMAADYIEQTGNHLMYQVTPLFDKRNLLCYGVVIQAISVEDGGKGINFAYFCPNVQPDVAINYEDGSSMTMDELITGKYNR